MSSKDVRRGMSDAITQAVLEIWAEQDAQSWLPIEGNSMRPLIQDGDRVLVQHAPMEIRRGDVIVFRAGEGLTAHRVLRVIQNDPGPIFITKGDNATQLDSPRSADHLLGRAVAVDRNGRQCRLDTPLWQTAGRSIAAGTLATRVLGGWAGAVKRRVLGPGPNRVTAALRRGARALFRWMLQASAVAFYRWKE